MILKKNAQIINIQRAVVDMLMISTSWMLSFALRFDTNLVALTKGRDTIINYLSLLPFLILSYLFVFIIFGLYKRSLEKQRIWDENFDLARKHLIAFFLFVTISFFIYEHKYSRVAMFFFLFIAPIFLPIGRSLVRKWNRFAFSRTKDKRKAVIIGTGPHVEKMTHAIHTKTEWNLRLVASYSLSQIAEIESRFEKDNVDLVFIIPSAEETSHVNELYQHFDKTLAEVLFIPYLGDRIFFEPSSVQIEGVTTIALNTSQLSGLGTGLKRMFDIAFSLSFLICFSPVYLICALFVKISSRGPVFYLQERMGLDGKCFKCIKFRGMYVDAEEKSGPVWAKKGDDRTTPVGKWLRKTSLDEIPQFINVLKGDMSIVGPRPERPVFVDHFKKQIPGYMLRHKAKAGITGWAQINGWRGNTSLEKRIECDLWYIQNWSIWLDIKIVLLTPFKGLVHPNAY
jgi:exopolysaccharide biosynthesis polyprenyl glycosylphosphotransferase